MSRTLCLLRHADTIWTGTDAIAGRTDVPLSEAGRNRVARLRDTLTDAQTSARWVTSPVLRTRQTTELLRVSTGLSGVVSDPRLVEIDFGDWEGSTWREVYETQKALLDAWGQDWIDTAPPNGESFRQQFLRCREWFDEQIDPALVVVTHGGCIRALLCHLLERPLHEAMRWSVDPCSVFRLTWRNGDSRWLLRAANHHSF